jgi:hypothetical protein
MLFICKLITLVASKLFDRMYSMDGFISGETLSFSYALVSDKQQIIYEELFHSVQQQIRNKPTSITIDFETNPQSDTCRCQLTITDSLDCLMKIFRCRSCEC